MCLFNRLYNAIIIIIFNFYIRDYLITFIAQKYKIDTFAGQ